MKCILYGKCTETLLNGFEQENSLWQLGEGYMVLSIYLVSSIKSCAVAPFSCFLKLQKPVEPMSGTVHKCVRRSHARYSPIATGHQVLEEESPSILCSNGIIWGATWGPWCKGLLQGGMRRRAQVRGNEQSHTGMLHLYMHPNQETQNHRLSLS